MTCSGLHDELVPAISITFRLRAPKQCTHRLAYDRINRGNASVESFCKSALCFSNGEVWAIVWIFRLYGQARKTQHEERLKILALTSKLGRWYLVFGDHIYGSTCLLLES